MISGIESVLVIGLVPIPLGSDTGLQVVSDSRNINKAVQDIGETTTVALSDTVTITLHYSSEVLKSGDIKGEGVQAVIGALIGIAELLYTVDVGGSVASPQPSIQEKIKAETQKILSKAYRCWYVNNTGDIIVIDSILTDISIQPVTDSDTRRAIVLTLANKAKEKAEPKKQNSVVVNKVAPV